MKDHRAPPDRFRSTAPHKPRTARKPVKFHHVRTPAGRVFTLFLLFYAEDLLGGADVVGTANMDRRYHERGLMQDALFAMIMKRCPEYATFYFEQTGGPLTPHICYDRVHKKLLYTNGKPGHGGSAGAGAEHYTRSKWLRPLVARVHPVYRSGRVIKLDEMIELGALPH